MTDFDARRIADRSLDTYQQTFEPKNKDEVLKIPGLNLLTLDRPLDSPRYVSFQSIGKKPLKFIYPNVYKIEVFHRSGHVDILKSLPQIVQAVETYFRAKVSEYNALLKAVKPTTATPEKYQQLQALGFT